VKILVLGHTGMLGHMVYKYLSNIYHEVETTEHRWSTEGFVKDMLSFRGQYVVNCIAAIPQRTNDFVINHELPIWLDKNLSCNIIHPGTDGELGNDPYGISKANASTWIKIGGKRTKIIKTSIIGPEVHNKVSLLEWFLNNKEKTVQGYNKFYWNGITTLQWSKICATMINNFENYDIINIPTSDRVSKYELLKIIKSVFDKKINIDKNPKVELERCLEKTDDMPHLDIKTQLEELKEFYYDS
jgi:dTDP-4-dehydrorhamnose reductase